MYANTHDVITILVPQFQEYSRQGTFFKYWRSHHTHRPNTENAYCGCARAVLISRNSRLRTRGYLKLRYLWTKHSIIDALRGNTNSNSKIRLAHTLSFTPHFRPTKEEYNVHIQRHNRSNHFHVSTRSFRNKRENKQNLTPFQEHAMLYFWSEML